ncbi:MAG: penicillin-binding transpeptidase domain-containing protein [Lachnospiraceae bacterium]|nr:penicillin-binding transpeptidase domain-containing protein [Lachnospiraceae bacterium]
MKLEREVTTASTRGKIYDRNGEVLAYSELSYSVAIEDNGTYETTKEKQHSLNETIYRLIQLIEKNGDESINDFGIIYENGKYQFVNEGTRLLRFKADVYGHSTIDQLETEQELATADEIMDYMCGEKRYRIDDGNYSDEDRLKILNVRYAMSSNSYKRYVKTTVASNVSEKTVAAVMENTTNLQGVSIEEDSIRVYPDAEYFASLIGWIGKASDEEIEGFNEEVGAEKYQLNDIVGKSGIEQYMELELQGTKGSQIIDVDSVGNILNVESVIEPIPGHDVYLSIDKNLQIACYNILEQKLAGILLEKITNTKTYTSTGRAKDIMIPIYDVYYACFDNNIIDIEQFTAEDASELEKSVQARFESKLVSVIQKLREELNDPNAKAYKDLSLEMKNYMSYIVGEHCLMGENNVLVPDSSDPMYTAWHKEESISLKTYLEYAISMNWINVSKIASDTPYLDSEEIYSALIDYIAESLSDDSRFGEMLYRFMLQEDSISGKETALLLYDQGVLDAADDEDYTKLVSGSMSAYDFFISKITKLEITPGMLALEPCSGGMIVTDPNTGDVLACVSYPGFDNNRLTNTMEADYYSQLLNDNARPMYSRATQEKTAPGSTLKPLVGMAGLCEGVITTSPANTITCTGVYTKVSNHPKCWVFTQRGGSHGAENLISAIKDSCNCYFYEVGFRLGSTGNGLSNEVGLEKLAKYATMFGLGDKSGLETEESEPQISDETIVPSAIGQGKHNYTVSQIARYVTTIANSGTCYNLSLLDKVTDSTGNLVEEYGSTVYNVLDVPQEYMTTIQQGMYAYAMNSSAVNNIGISSAGKTGTAEQSVNHPNHALFIGYAPFENPEIAVAVRIANGYTSANAASMAADVYKYYFELVEEEELLSGEASAVSGTVAGD